MTKVIINDYILRVSLFLLYLKNSWLFIVVLSSNDSKATLKNLKDNECFTMDGPKIPFQ